MQIRILSERQIVAANEALKSMGLKVFSGSYNVDNLKFDIMIDKGCSVNYNEEKVAKRLKKVLNARSICLDGRYEY